jgi:outer membrane lipoprotein
VDYAEGRAISVLGQITGVTVGAVGEAEYKYPAVDASDIHLWNENAQADEPRVRFGIGVNIGL